MKSEIQNALSELRVALMEILGDNLMEMRLFGSRARGDEEPDSDVDVLVLLKNRSTEIDRLVAEVAAELSLKYDLLLMPLRMTPEELADHEDMETLLYRNLMNEGIVI